jgi:hypothetical protein
MDDLFSLRILLLTSAATTNFLPYFQLQYSYELLLQYLQKTQALVVLGVINEHITFEGTILCIC